MYNTILRCIKFRHALALSGSLLLLGLAVSRAPAQTAERIQQFSQSNTKDQNRIGSAKEKLPEILYDLKKLPGPVLKKRNAILQAAKTGDLNALKQVLADNKLVPNFSFGGEKDPLAFWKQSSADKTGRDILAEMVRVFSSGFVLFGAGTPNEVYIWPYHFAHPLDKLTPAQEVELYLLITPEERKAMVDAGGYIGYRGGISPNGTWQFFVAGD